MKRELKETVGMRCENCGLEKKWLKDLTIHHIDGNNKNNLPNNHRVLCWPCHERHHPKDVTAIVEKQTLEWENDIWDMELIAVQLASLSSAERREIKSALEGRLREARRGSLNVNRKCAVCEKYWNKKDLCLRCPGLMSGLCSMLVFLAKSGKKVQLWLENVLVIM